MKTWIILGILLLAACTAQSEIINEEIINETITEEELPPEPLEEPTYEVVDGWEQCDGENYPCLLKEETSNEYNACETDDECVFAPLPSCACPKPGVPGKAVNEDKVEKYSADREVACENIDIEDCAQYGPPSLRYKNEAKCVENICRAVRASLSETSAFEGFSKENAPETVIEEFTKHNLYRKSNLLICETKDDFIYQISTMVGYGGTIYQYDLEGNLIAQKSGGDNSDESGSLIYTFECEYLISWTEATI